MLMVKNCHPKQYLTIMSDVFLGQYAYWDRFDYLQNLSFLGKSYLKPIPSNV